jgi:[acyl-carrier-protein] S-malonyltransferase
MGDNHPSMVNNAYIFSGQGAQAVGMGKILFENDSPGKEIFLQANEILGFDLTKVCLEGPQEELNRTDICQPALLVHGLAMLRHYEAEHGSKNPEVTAGLSLGEYTAHVYAGSLSLEDGVRLVQKRGQYMQEACDATPSGMASIIGMKEDQVTPCLEGDVGVANLNAPGQIVISGEKEALKAASAKCKEAGARKVIPLRVAGAYHSVVMTPAAEKMKAELAEVAISSPRIPVYANYTATPLTDPEEIRSALGNQVCGTVRWEASVRAMGAKNYFEFGPGKILAGMIRRIDPDAIVESIE